MKGQDLAASEHDLRLMRPAHALRLYHGLPRSDVAAHLGYSTSPLAGLENNAGWTQSWPQFKRADAYELAKLYRTDMKTVRRESWVYNHIHAVERERQRSAAEWTFHGSRLMILANAMADMLIRFSRDRSIRASTPLGATLVQHRALTITKWLAADTMALGRKPWTSCRAYQALQDGFKGFLAESGVLVQPVPAMADMNLAAALVWCRRYFFRNEKEYWVHPPILFYDPGPDGPCSTPHLSSYVRWRRARMLFGNENRRTLFVEHSVSRLGDLTRHPSDCAPETIKDLARLIMMRAPIMPLPHHLAETYYPYMPEANAGRIKRALRKMRWPKRDRSEGIPYLNMLERLAGSAEVEEYVASMSEPQQECWSLLD